jgi:hypothetical protein
MEPAQVACSQCGWQDQPFAPAPPAKLGDDPTMRLILPVGRSLWAIAAGYLGLVSLIVIPAPLALITGVIAVIDIKRHPEKSGMGRAVFGIVMGGLVCLSVIAVLIASAVT